MEKTMAKKLKFITHLLAYYFLQNFLYILAMNKGYSYSLFFSIVTGCNLEAGKVSVFSLMFSLLTALPFILTTIAFHDKYKIYEDYIFLRGEPNEILLQKRSSLFIDTLLVLFSKIFVDLMIMSIYGKPAFTIMHIKMYLLLLIFALTINLIIEYFMCIWKLTYRIALSSTICFFLLMQFTNSINNEFSQYSAFIPSLASPASIGIKLILLILLNFAVISLVNGKYRKKGVL